MKNVDLKYQVSKTNTFSIVSAGWTNHDFGYTCYLPQDIHIENVNMIGWDATVTNGVRTERILETNVKEIYLFTSKIYSYTSFDISDPNAVISTMPNDWKKCTCETRPDSEFYNSKNNLSNIKRYFNDTDGDGRCNNNVVGQSGQSVWCWGFKEQPDLTTNACPYIGTKNVVVINSDPNNPIRINWPLTPQFKDMDVTVDGVLIIENGKKVKN
jgi:hypothetical protein